MAKAIGREETYQATMTQVVKTPLKIRTKNL